MTTYCGVSVDTRMGPGDGDAGPHHIERHDSVPTSPNVYVYMRLSVSHRHRHLSAHFSLGPHHTRLTLAPYRKSPTGP